MSPESTKPAETCCSPAPATSVANQVGVACQSYLKSITLPLMPTQPFNPLDPTSCENPEPTCKIKEVLPSEMHLEIFKHLSYMDKARLRGVDHYFHATIPAPTTPSQLYAAELEDEAKEMDLLTCRFCLRLRPTSKFEDSMKTGKRDRNGKQRKTRTCVDCGIRRDYYTHGSWFMMDGK